MINEPYYDEDPINKGYLDKVLGNTTDIIENDISMVKNYGTQPSPPYHKGDTWTNGSILYVCIETREIGQYDAKDWITENGAIELAQNALDVAILKNRTFLIKPTVYNSNDQWILEDDTVHDPDKTGTILISIANSNIYVKEHWVKKDNYADNVLVLAIKTIADAATNTINTISQTLEGISLIVGNQELYIDPVTEELIDAITRFSQIQSTFESINLEVSNKVNANEIISKINLSPEIIKLLSSKIALEGYTTINGSFTVDILGNVSIANGSIILNNTGITLANGARLIGSNGVLSTFVYESGDWQTIGYYDTGGNGFVKNALELSAFIPNNFVIVSAIIKLQHSPRYLANLPNSSGYTEPFTDQWCYSRNLKVYTYSSSNYYLKGSYASEWGVNTNLAVTEIIGALGSSGFTAIPPTVPPTSNPQNVVQTVTSSDIKASLVAGSYNNIKIETSDAPPNFETDWKSGYTKTALIRATLTVIGYMKQ